MLVTAAQYEQRLASRRWRAASGGRRAASAKRAPRRSSARAPTAETARRAHTRERRRHDRRCARILVVSRHVAAEDDHPRALLERCALVVPHRARRRAARVSLLPCHHRAVSRTEGEERQREEASLDGLAAPRRAEGRLRLPLRRRTHLRGQARSVAPWVSRRAVFGSPSAESQRWRRRVACDVRA